MERGYAKTDRAYETAPCCSVGVLPANPCSNPVNGAPPSFERVELPSGRDEATDEADVDPAVAMLLDVRLTGRRSRPLSQTNPNEHKILIMGNIRPNDILITASRSDPH